MNIPAALTPNLYQLGPTQNAQNVSVPGTFQLHVRTFSDVSNTAFFDQVRILNMYKSMEKRGTFSDVFRRFG